MPVPAALVAAAILYGGGHGPVPTGAPPAQLKHWQDQKLGLTVRFGPGAALARTAQTPAFVGELTAERWQTYLQSCRAFRPYNFSGDVWAETVRAAGARYFVFPVKGPDGFCLWDSRLTDHKVTSRHCAYSTASQPDLLAELARAFESRRLDLGLTYSLVDWRHVNGCWHSMHPDYAPGFLANQSARWHDFTAFAQGQVRELLTRYGEVAYLRLEEAWPTGAAADYESLVRLARTLKPDLLLETAVATPYQDFVPAPEGDGSAASPWEARMPLRAAAGHSLVSTAELIRGLADVASRGGNLLLELTALPDGRLPVDETQVLRGLGRWLQANGEAIYGTQPSPLAATPTWGRATCRGNMLYLLVFEWPGARAALKVEASLPVTEATLLSTGQQVGVKRLPGQRGLALSLPAQQPDAAVSVVALKCAADVQLAAIEK